MDAGAHREHKPRRRELRTAVGSWQCERMKPVSRPQYGGRKAER